MRRRIGFVANFHMTETYHAVAEVLQRNGVDVFWFTLSERWARWLERRGIDCTRIVRLTDIAGREGVWPSPMLAPSLPGSTRQPWEPSPLEAIEGDRVLRLRSLDQTLESLGFIVGRFRERIESLGVNAVFGESTWAAEVVLAYAAAEMSVPYLSPQMVRYPTGRFGFFRAPSQAELLELRGPRAGDREVAERAERDLLRTDRSSPGLWAHNRVSMDRFLRQPRLLWEKVWLGAMDSATNPTQMSVGEYLRAKNPRMLKAATNHAMEAMKVAIKDPSELSHPYLLMPLQVQPEASVDVLAWWARDQILNVRRVAEAAQGKYVVAVKEHSHQFGSRRLGFYEDLVAIPGVVLVDAFVPSRHWADRAEAVVTPTGSMALENALRGGNSVVFTKLYFDSLPTVTSVSPGDFSAISRDAFDMGPSDAFETGSRFLANIMRRSHEGLISNPRSNPEVLDPANMASVSQGFLMALDVLPSESVRP